MSNDSFAVIFDMDGVLVDSNPAHFEAFKRVGEQLGVPFTRELLLQTIGMHNNQIFPFWLGDGLQADRVVELSLLKESIYRSIAADTLRAIPGAVELVRELHAAGVPLAVGSSGPRANVELAVKILGIREYFDVLITGDDVKHGKPAPDIFLKAAAALDVPTSQCVVIEDAPGGIQAALTAGMKVVAVATSKGPEHLKEANLVLNGMEELTIQSISGLLI